MIGNVQQTTTEPFRDRRRINIIGQRVVLEDGCARRRRGIHEVAVTIFAKAFDAVGYAPKGNDVVAAHDDDVFHVRIEWQDTAIQDEANRLRDGVGGFGIMALPILPHRLRFGVTIHPNDEPLHIGTRGECAQRLAERLRLGKPITCGQLRIVREEHCAYRR